MAKRIEATPVRRVTGIIKEERSPGTPPDKSGVKSGVGIIRPVDIQIQKYARRFRQKLGISSASPVDGYVSDLVGALLVGQVDPEDLQPDDVLWSGVAVMAAGGAAPSQVACFNPLNSKLLIIVERVYVHSSLATDIQVRYGNAALSSLVAGQSEAFDDTRLGAGALTRLLTAQAGALAGGVGNQFEIYPVQAGIILPFPIGPYIIAPGVSLSLNSSVNNTTLTVTFRLRLTPLPVAA